MFINQTKHDSPARDLLTAQPLKSILFAFLLLAAISLGSVPSADAQPIRANMDGSGASLKDNYQLAVTECRIAIKHSRREAMLYFDRGLDEASERSKKWKNAMRNLRDKHEKLRVASVALFLDEQEPEDELIDLMLQVGPDLIEGDNPTEAMTVVKKLRGLRPDILPLQRDEALLALRMNEFDEAIEFKKLATEELIEELTPMRKGLFSFAPLLKETFEKELEFRTAEAEADDLPRVEIKTVHGDIVIELFENEAPETVANFIYLVELGFYDGTYFHRVVKDFVAQAGAYTKLGRQDCGYQINDEMRNENSRKHFRGSVCMHNNSSPNSGSSQFYIATSPTPILDWNGTAKDVSARTVFGRVISGMEAVDKLKLTYEVNEEESTESLIEGVTEPDEIVKATVLRKRDHEYKPTRITSEK